MCGCLSYAPIGDLTPNPGMCPEWELNQRPYGSQPVLNPLSHTGQGLYEALKKISNAGPTPGYLGQNLGAYIFKAHIVQFFLYNQSGEPQKDYTFKKIVHFSS